MTQPPTHDQAIMKWIVPIGRSSWAIAAGYAGLFALLIYPAPLALLLGLKAWHDLEQNPELEGSGRALFGTAMGLIGTMFLLWAYLAR